MHHLSPPQILLNNSLSFCFVFATRCRELLGNEVCIFHFYPWTVSPAPGEQRLCCTHYIPDLGPGMGHSTGAQCSLGVLSIHNELCTVQSGRVNEWMGGWMSGWADGWVGG